GVTKLRAHKGLEPIAGELTLALLVQPFEIGQHALERASELAHFTGSKEAELELLGSGAMQKNAFEIIGQILIRLFQALLVMRSPAAQHGFLIADHPFPAAAPGEHGALFERLFGVWYHQRFVENHFLTQTVTNRARS